MFNNENSATVVAALRTDIERFMRDHVADLEVAFDTQFGVEFDAGPDTKGFLEMVLGRLTKG